jgi:protein-S-isoprenylcysteine O-methyltransferase Ste14
VSRSLAGAIVSALWLGWCLYWFIAARDVKAIVKRESAGSRFLHVAPLVAAAALFMISPAHLPAVLTRRWLPLGWGWYWLGVAMIAIGLGFATWARVHLGRNWSGTVALKQGHDLVRSGPYALVRHPIYSGLSLAFLGSAFAWGDWRGLLAFACAMVAILARMGAEDRLMAATFGEAYARYRRDTRALIPYVI